MSKIKPILVVAAIVLLSACASSQRWQIHETKFVVNEASETKSPQNSRFENTILLDHKTGESWILWPEKSGHIWKKIQRN